MFDTALFIIQAVATAVCVVLIPTFFFLVAQVLKGDEYE